MPISIANLSLINQQALYTNVNGSRKFNVQHFGAVGNGITNSTAAFQQVFARINAIGGGTVYIPEGTYVLSAIDFLLSGNNIIIESDEAILRGSYTPVEGATAGGTGTRFIINSNVDVLELKNVRFENFAKCIQTANTDTFNNSSYRVNEVYVRDCHFTNCFNGLVLDINDNFDMDKCYFKGMGSPLFTSFSDPSFMVFARGPDSQKTTISITNSNFEDSQSNISYGVYTKDAEVSIDNCAFRNLGSEFDTTKTDTRTLYHLGFSEDFEEIGTVTNSSFENVGYYYIFGYYLVSGCNIYHGYDENTTQINTIFTACEKIENNIIVLNDAKLGSANIFNNNLVSKIFLKDRVNGLLLNVEELKNNVFEEIKTFPNGDYETVSSNFFEPTLYMFYMGNNNIMIENNKFRFGDIATGNRFQINPDNNFFIFSTQRSGDSVDDNIVIRNNTVLDLQRTNTANTGYRNGILSMVSQPGKEDENDIINFVYKDNILKPFSINGINLHINEDYTFNGASLDRWTSSGLSLLDCRGDYELPVITANTDLSTNNDEMALSLNKRTLACSGTIAITLPNPRAAFEFEFINYGAGTITIDPFGEVTNFVKPDGTTTTGGKYIQLIDYGASITLRGLGTGTPGRWAITNTSGNIAYES